MLLAVAALIAALAGTAVAVDKITSKDIAKDAVRSKHVRDGQVKARDGNVVRLARGAGEVTHSGGEVDLGPRIKLALRRGDLLHVHLAATMHLTGSDPGDCFVKLRVQGPPGDFDRFALEKGLGDPATVYMDGTAQGTTNLARLIGRDVPITESGKYTISLIYLTDPGSNCTYSNRRLWVEHSR